MKVRQNILPLLLKSWALFLLLLLIVLIPTGIAIVHQGKQSAYAALVSRGKLLVRHLAAGAGIPLLSRDTLALKLLVKEVNDDQDILYAFVTDTKSSILVRTGSIEPLEVLRIVRRSAASDTRQKVEALEKISHVYPFIPLSSSIVYRGKAVGTFHLGLSREAAEREMENRGDRLIRSIFRYAIPGFILGLAFLFFCVRYVVGYAEALLTGINELSMNNPGFQIKRIPRGLFGELITGFNRLSLGLEDGSEKEKTVAIPPRTMGIQGKYLFPASELLPTQITRNQITVLFAGVKGFREYAENRSPEDIIIDLNEYFSIAARVAAGYDGQVDKFIGDAVSCVFQSTPLKPDHTKRAVEAALALQATLVEQHEKGNDILNKVGIGISTGVALSGPVDALQSKIHTFIGESFKTAYSLNVLAGPGEIIISKDVFQAIEHLIMVEPIPPREIMEKTEAWENFRLKGLLPRENHEATSR